jgi:hypothetical protein
MVARMDTEQTETPNEYEDRIRRCAAEGERTAIIAEMRAAPDESGFLGNYANALEARVDFLPLRLHRRYQVYLDHFAAVLGHNEPTIKPASMQEALAAALGVRDACGEGRDLLTLAGFERDLRAALETPITDANPTSGRVS